MGQRAEASYHIHLLCREMVCLCSRAAFGCKLGTDAVGLEIKILAAVRVSDEDFHAAVFPYRAVVFESFSPKVIFGDFEQDGQRLV